MTFSGSAIRSSSDITTGTEQTNSDALPSSKFNPDAESWTSLELNDASLWTQQASITNPLLMALLQQPASLSLPSQSSALEHEANEEIQRWQQLNFSFEDGLGRELQLASTGPASSRASPKTTKEMNCALSPLNEELNHGNEDPTLIEKRKRNQAASARFRQRKKEREHQLQQSVHILTDRCRQLEARIKELEMQNQWLRDLVVTGGSITANGKPAAA